MISLANGCVCCSIRDDLSQAIIDVIERPERPEFILLEASGVAEPTGIALTFADEPSLIDRVRLDSIICVLDAEQVFAAPEHMELKIWQVATADMVVLNKTDLVGPEQTERIVAWLDDHLHRYRLLQAERCDVPLDVLLGVGRFDPDHPEPDRADTPRAAPIRAATTQSTPTMTAASNRGASKPTGRSRWTHCARWRRSSPQTSTGPRASSPPPRRPGTGGAAGSGKEGGRRLRRRVGRTGSRARGSSRSARPGRSARETWKSTLPPAWRKAPATAQLSGVCRADRAGA